MSTPLNKEEQIRAVALGLAHIWKHKKAGDHEKLIRGLDALKELYGDDEANELIELSKRATYEALTIIKKAAASAWPKVEKPKPNPNPEPKSMDDYMHEMPHDKRILCLAIGLANAWRKNQPKEAYAMHVRQLKAMVTEEDVKWCQNYMIESLKKCGCDECKKRLVVIDKVKAVNAIEETLDELVEFMEKKEEEKSEDKPDDYDPEDPFRTLSA